MLQVAFDATDGGLFAVYLQKYVMWMSIVGKM